MDTPADPQNEREVSFGASGGAVPHHDLLRAPALGQWFALRSEITSQWKQSEDRSSRGRLADLRGCLEKLESTLLQGKRLRSYHDALITEARSLQGTNIQGTARQGSDACADFEAFVLQGRSAHDRLTWFIGRAFKNPCQSFRRLKNVLADFAGKDESAQEILNIATAADDCFDGTFGKLETDQSLRDLVAHHHALVEGTRTCFAVVRTEHDRALILDCEVELPGLPLRLPVLRTAHISIGFLSFVVLNSVAVFLGVDRLPLEE